MTTVWVVNLDASDVLTPKRLALLDDGERERASRFRSATHADRWRVAHIALRDILASVVAADPAALRFALDARGKPSLATAQRIEFNLSHAAGVALVAVTDGAAVGVDVEQLREVPEMRGVVSAHFAPEEQAALWAASEEERLATFYRIWTRKESYVKATGVGIGPALARFAVTDDVTAPRLLYARDTPRLDRWSMHSIEVPQTYVAALCVAEPAPQVSIREWTAP